MMQYSKEIIDMLSAYIRDDSSGYNYLIEKNLKELLLLKPALLGHEQSTNWLMHNKHTVLVAFIKAVRDDKEALMWLLNNKNSVWAATANVANKDKGAAQWLRTKGFSHYAELGEAIKQFFEDNDAADMDNILRGPIR